MNKQNQTENKNSLFTEIELDEAVNVNGGYLGVPDYRPGGFLTYSAYFLSQNPSKFRLKNTLPRRGSRNFGRFDRNTVGILTTLRNNGIRI